MNKGQLVYSIKDDRLYVFLEHYNPGSALLSPVTKSGTYDEEEQWVEDLKNIFAVYSEEDIRLARLLFKKI